MPVSLRASPLACTALLVMSALLPACSRPVSHSVLDTVMACTHRPDMASHRGRYAPFEILAGDLHVHVAPPDSPPHVTRGIAETVALARDENLDFVVLTPHIWSNFFESQALRAAVSQELRDLRRAISNELTGNTTFIVGFEYTDFGFGHVGGAFADIDEVLAAVPADEASASPGRFFEEYVKRGGLLIINHPLLVPVESVIDVARWDLSWRPFFETGPFPEEINAAGRLAQGVEVFNLAIAELRDRFLLWDSHKTIRDTFRRIDREIVERGRPMIPLGGSDSHSGHVRATTFILSRGRSEEAIREAILAGRVCVRDPAGCSFMVRAERGPWLSVGSSVQGVRSLQAKARGHSIKISVNGRTVDAGDKAEIEIPLDSSRCSVIRAQVDEGYSGPIYANCPF
ncbi:MAG: hypothetical protein L6Q76_11745 [Polyangiaceae bacterium]|nr:hypothetical protein [Polyangiaceae bacterium]